MEKKTEIPTMAELRQRHPALPDAYLEKLRAFYISNSERARRASVIVR